MDRRLGYCIDCRYFALNKHECRRHAPIRLPRKFAPEADAGNRVRDETLIFGWPTVESSDWCGEWAAYEPA